MLEEHQIFQVAIGAVQVSVGNVTMAQPMASGCGSNLASRARLSPGPLPNKKQEGGEPGRF